MSIYRCNRCPYTTASHFLLKEHEFSTHVQNIKIDPNSPRAPTSVSFGPDVVKAPTSIHVSHSEAVQRGYGVDDVYITLTLKVMPRMKMRRILKMKARVILRIKIYWKLLMILNQPLIIVCN